MAFSESFDIGNSTLKNIEVGAKICEITPIENNLKKGNCDEVIEVIDESPTNKLNKTKSENRLAQRRNASNKKKKFQKSKSGNTLKISQLNNFSDFFKSDLSFKELLPGEEGILIKEAVTDNYKNYSNYPILKNNFSASGERSSLRQPTLKTALDKNINKKEFEFDDDFDFFSNSLQKNIEKAGTVTSDSIKQNEKCDVNVLNATLNPSFVFVNSEDQADLLTKELQKSKKDLHFLEDEQVVFLNLSSKLENLSTSEKPLLHFSLTSEDSFKNESFKESDKVNNCRQEIKQENRQTNHFTAESCIKKDNDLTSRNSALLISSHSNGTTRAINDIENTSKLRNFKDKESKSKCISEWNLPLAIVKEYKKKGITNMFDWQVKCLSNPKILFENRNLVYSAPTSAGKTLISEIIAIKNILERNKKVIFILPFVSVVREKMFYLQDLLSSSGYRIEGFFGGYSPPGGFDSIHLAICTIEKANSIINRLLEQGKLDTLGCIVIDEIHLLSDPGRGYILELLLTKILYMSRKFSQKIQIVTMSATLPNCELLTQWLDAELFLTDFRPVELKEMIKVGKKIYNNEFHLIRTLDSSCSPEIQNDQDEIAVLCIETLLQGCSVIIFCPSKEWCENLSKNLSKIIKCLCNSYSEVGSNMLKIINKESVSKIKDQLKSLPNGCDKVLQSTCEYGCAFHHAGLTIEERDAVETGFKSGLLKIIVATSTLSSGVNLPARRVIIRSPLFGGKPMDSLTYKQMIGRAGRTGKDTLGESFLICNEQTAKIGKNLVTANLKPLSSCLGYDNGIHLKRALLEIIASGAAKTLFDLESFTNCTLYSISSKIKNSDNEFEEEKFDPIESSLNFLIEYEFIRAQKANESEEAYYVPSRLGMACLTASLPPTDGIILFSELQRSRKCFVLESELHAVYLVTPYSVCYQLQNLDWLHYLDIWEKLSPGMKKVAEIVGVKESFLVRAMRFQNKLDYKSLQIHKRFYTALALQELVNEVPINTVAIKYKCNRGLLQSLQQMSSTFASIVTSFCNSLNWKTLALIVSQFKERLYFGVHNDLVDLMRIPDMSSKNARALFNAGIETLVHLANSEFFLIEKVLYDSYSFESSKKQDDEDEYEAQKRNTLRKIYLTGKIDVTVKEVTEMLITEARKFLQHELGVNCNWHTNENSNKTKSIVNDGASNHSNSSVDQEEEKTDEIKLVNSEIKQKQSNNNLKSMVEGSNNLNDSKEISLPIQPLPKCVSADDLDLKKMDIDIFIPPVNVKVQCSSEDLSNKFVKINDKENDTRLDSEESSLQISNISKESLIKNPQSINHLTNNTNSIEENISNEKLSIINAPDNFELYQNYFNEILKIKNIGFSVGIERLQAKPKPIIGCNILAKGYGEEETVDFKKFIIDDNYIITGISISYAENTALYIDLQNNESHTLQNKLTFLREIFYNEELKLRIYDAKEQIKILKKIVFPDCEIKNGIEDPKIANWLLQPDKDMNFNKMILQYAPECISLLEEILNYKGYQSLALNYNSSISGKIRACYESFMSNILLRKQLEYLESYAEGQIKKFFYELEMPIQKILAHSEVIGISASAEKMGELSQQMFDTMKKLERKIYNLHGSCFNLGSTSAVARVLGLHRKPNGKLSTSKQILERIDSPISNLILDYRKINAVLTKNIQPLQKVIKFNKIHGNSITTSSTGRISMYEPNIQNVAKDFNIRFDDNTINISCRSTFTCPPGRYLLSADFCQLEMRILTHLSQDKNLKAAIFSDKDIFTAIAAKWNKISEETVSEELRNGTKQICYGIIYGMGIKALSENLKCTEQEAISLTEQFHAAYPGIRAYIQKVIRFAKQNGFVETITGRRRYLEHINNTEGSLRNQAERQAVNSTIQGSAADIVKSALLKMEKNVKKYESKLGVNIPNNSISNVELVLHLHDELIYEVPEDKVRNVAKVLKTTMESSVKLSVPLNVKLKAGKSWGQLLNI